MPSDLFDGPTVAQGTVGGTWFASGTVTCDAAVSGGVNFIIKLWDGTTVIASTVAFQNVNGAKTTLSLSGFITNPAGNLRLSVNCTDNTGVMLANYSGLGKDSTITAFRIA